MHPGAAHTLGMHLLPPAAVLLQFVLAEFQSMSLAMLTVVGMFVKVAVPM
jgi:hypothetical protein